MVDRPQPGGTKHSARTGGGRSRAAIRPLRWVGGPEGVLKLLDQTRLPQDEVWVACERVESLFDAIRRLVVRGAPAIGVAAAYGVVLGIGRGWRRPDGSWLARVEQVCEMLAASRPTAVNLFCALERMRRRARQLVQKSPPPHGRGSKHGPGRVKLSEARAALMVEAHAIRDEDAAMCRAIGAAGESLIRSGTGVLTHCNAGALATAEYGTALAVMYAAHERGRRFCVYVGETRPLLQGSRLTTWELMRAGIDTTLICDSMAAQVMKEGRVHLVITGADRIAANGDTANKIGTYGLAVLARTHGIPFYVAAPSTTFDLSIADGSSIPIEQRDALEIVTGFGRATAPTGVRCYNPAFDVTPAKLIAGIITERGLIAPATRAAIARVLGRHKHPKPQRV